MVSLRSSIAIAVLLLCLSCSLSSAQPEWERYIGTTKDGRYDKPCEVKDTVERAATHDFVRCSELGDRCCMDAFLRDDAILRILNVAVERSYKGGQNISLYLSGMIQGSRIGYHIDTSIEEYELDIIQEGNVVGVAINQTVVNIFGPAQFRQDYWQITFDEYHRIKSIDIIVSDLYPQLALATNPDPVLDPENSMACGSISASYIRCIGKKENCHGYKKPCKLKPNTLLKDITEYIRGNISTNFQYNDLYLVLMNNSRWWLTSVGAIFYGPDHMVQYFKFGDPTNLDPLFVVVNSTTISMIQNGDLVMGIFEFTFYAFQTQKYFVTRSFWYYVYTPEHYLFDMIQNVDSLSIVNNLAFSLNTSIDYICSGASTFCTGDNLQFPVPYGPYQNLTCEAFMSLLPINSGFGVPEFGFNLGCKSFHLRLAANYPESHCNHVGAKPGLTPCVDGLSARDAPRTFSPEEQSLLLLSKYIRSFTRSGLARSRS